MGEVYPSAFERSRPNLTIPSVSSRLNLLKSLTVDFSSYLSERAALEDSYLKSLVKLQSRLLSSGGKDSVLSAVEGLGLDKREEEQQLGAWKDVRKTLVGEVEVLMRVHESWKKKVEVEVVGPLRASVGKGQWQKWNGVEASLNSQCKDYEGTLEKVNKAQSKSSSSKPSKSTTSKLLSTQSHLSSLTSSLSSSLPSFLSLSESLELSHSTFLKESLIRYGTLSSDLGREKMEMGERVLVGVLGVDEGVEMQTWALRESMRCGGNSSTTGGGVNGGGGRERSATESTQATGLGEFGGGGRPIPPTRGSSLTVGSEATNEVRERQITSSFTSPLPPALPIPLPTSTTPSKQKSDGFKLSSLLKRDRSSSIPQNASRVLDQHQPVPSSSTLTRRTSDDSSLLGGGGGGEGPEEAFGIVRGGSGSGSGSGMQAPIRPDNRQQNSFGSASANAKKRESSLNPFTSSSSGSGSGGGGGGGGGIFRRPSKASETGNSFAPLSEGGVGGEVDEDGYTVKPKGYDRDIGVGTIGVSGAGAGGANLMDEEDEEESSSLPTSLPLPKLPVLSPTPLLESEQSRQAALESLKSTLSTPTGGLVRKPTAARGRRDQSRRETLANPFGGSGSVGGSGSSGGQGGIGEEDDVPLGRILEQRSTTSGGGVGGQGEGGFSASPTTSSLPSLPFSPGASISSSFPRSSSLLSTSSRPSKSDPFEGMTGEGVRVWIGETVNCLIKSGEVGRVMVTGEVGLKIGGSVEKGMKIKILGWDQLAKNAPNLAVISPSSSSGDGVFDISPNFSGGGGTTTILKYQLNIPVGEESRFVPLLGKASWKCEKGLTRVIVGYSVISGSQLSLSTSSEASPFGDDEETLRLENVSFSLPISQPISSQQSKPLASYTSPNLIFSLPNSLAPTTSDEKLLASVNTEGEGVVVPQPVGVRWRIEGRTFGGIGVEVVGGEGVREVKRGTESGKYVLAP